MACLATKIYFKARVFCFSFNDTQTMSRYWCTPWLSIPLPRGLRPFCFPTNVFVLSGLLHLYLLICPPLLHDQPSFIFGTFVIPRWFVWEKTSCFPGQTYNLCMLWTASASWTSNLRLPFLPLVGFGTIPHTTMCLPLDNSFVLTLVHLSSSILTTY